MARDEFSDQTRDTLAKRVGVRCSNPSCRKLTTGPRTASKHIINIGVAAHITAAAGGGSRYDPLLTPAERRSPDNGIWLCQNCAKLVDNDPTRYPVDVLQDWKARSEAFALAEIEGGAKTLPVDLSAEIDLSYKKERSSTDERYDYRLKVTLTNRGTEPLGSYHIDLEMPARVVDRPRDQVVFVPDRSTPDVAFFRVTERNHGDDLIYPGDLKLLMSVDYYMDKEIYIDRGNLFDQPVRATLYRPGIQPLILERWFGQFQDF